MFDGNDWSRKIFDALWAYRTAYKTPLGMSPFRLIFVKACYLPIELEQKAFWATRQLNLSMDDARKKRILDLHDSMRLGMKLMRIQTFTKRK